MIFKKPIRTGVSALIVATALLGASSFVVAVGAVRWRTDGHDCLLSAESVRGGPTSGPAMSGAGTSRAVCSIPLGPDLVDIGPGAVHPLRYVATRITARGLDDTYVSQALIAHDSTNDDYCVCDRDSDWKAPGNHLTYLDFVGDATSPGCDACPGGPVPAHWVTNVRMDFLRAAGGAADVSIKRIGAFE
ncbi:MAG TPA: hypothetical protein VGF45_07620 [Polyangia bacterium]